MLAPAPPSSEPIVRSLLPLALSLALCAASGSCRATSTRSSLASDRSPSPRALEAPAGWRTASSYGFERLALAWPPADAPAELDEASFAELTHCLALEDETGVRAAVLLARSRDPRAGEALLERLEARVLHELRHGDAPDVVAAAALYGWDFRPDVPDRLATLADGPEPHPDLEVRIECAASALGFGRDEVIPFLLRVLRSNTPAETIDPPDWPPTETMAWSKSRAAEALARRAGVEPDFRPDGSFEDEMRSADRLAHALGR